MPFKRTPEQIRNLENLAKGLRTLPKDDDRFDMGSYYLIDPETMNMDMTLTAEDYPLEHPCDSAACAIGWGPTFTGVHPIMGETWAFYAARIFGTHDWLHDAGRFMFGPDMGGGPSDAADRIDLVLSELHRWEEDDRDYCMEVMAEHRHRSQSDYDDLY